MFITFAASKGGCSKSTLSCHLALWLHDRGYRIGFLDADPQKTSSQWLRLADASIRVINANDIDGVRRGKAELLTSHDIVVADTPGVSGDASYATTLLSTFVVIPLQPSKPDLLAIKESLKVVRLAQEMTGTKSPEFRLVLTMTAKGDIQTRRLRSEIESLNYPVANAEVRRLNAFRDSFGTSVARQASREAQEATKDIEQLFTELFGDRIAAMQEKSKMEVANG